MSSLAFVLILTSGLLHALFDFLGQFQQVHVACVAFVPHAADADLPLVHVVGGHPRPKQHRLRRPLALGLSDSAAVLVELRHEGPSYWREIEVNWKRVILEATRPEF